MSSCGGGHDALPYEGREVGRKVVVVRVVVVVVVVVVVKCGLKEADKQATST